MSTLESDKREKAIKFLMESFGEPRKPDEFTVFDICEIFKLNKRAVHFRMQELVSQGLWETRMVYVDEYKRKMRLWRLKD